MAIAILQRKVITATHESVTTLQIEKARAWMPIIRKVKSGCCPLANEVITAMEIGIVDFMRGITMLLNLQKNGSPGYRERTS